VPPYVYALIVHGVIGFLDVVINHEFLFAALFASLAWCEWHGAFVWWIEALFAGELLVTARDGPGRVCLGRARCTRVAAPLQWADIGLTRK